MIGAPPPKKAIMICILRILEEYSDAEHTLSQEEIKALLESEYSLKVDRKAVKRNLSDLIDLGYNISFAQDKKRKILNKQTGEYEDSDICSDYYIEREFDDSELLLLLDSVIFSPHIPGLHRKELIEKIEKLSSKYFKNSTKSVEVVNSVTSQNWDWFYTLDVVNKAIINMRRIRFTYSEYGIDKQLQPIEEITVCPYRIIAHNNHYYLLSNELPFDNIVHYRIDRITDVVMLDDPISSPLMQSFDVNEYINAHPFMFSGKRESIRIIVDRSVLGDVYDWFGKDVRIIALEDDRLDITLTAAVTDLYYWALRYGDAVEVISPKELRYRIRETVETMTRAYLKNKDDKVQRTLGKADKSGVLDLRHPEMRDAKIDRIPEGLEELIIDSSYTHDFSFISRIRGLKRLKVYNLTDDFSFLKGMDSLTELSLHNTGFNDMSVISGLPLEKLYLDETSVDHLDLVYEMPFLKELWLTRSLANTIDIKLLKERNPQINVDVISGGNIRTYLRKAEEPKG